MVYCELLEEKEVSFFLFLVVVNTIYINIQRVKMIKNDIINKPTGYFCK